MSPHSKIWQNFGTGRFHSKIPRFYSPFLYFHSKVFNKEAIIMEKAPGKLYFMLSNLLSLEGGVVEGLKNAKARVLDHATSFKD